MRFTNSHGRFDRITRVEIMNGPFSDVKYSQRLVVCIILHLLIYIF